MKFNRAVYREVMGCRLRMLYGVFQGAIWTVITMTIFLSIGIIAEKYNPLYALAIGIAILVLGIFGSPLLQKRMWKQDD